MVRPLKSLLTYRALRLAGDLSPDQIKGELVAIIATLVGVENKSPI